MAATRWLICSNVVQKCSFDLPTGSLTGGVEGEPPTRPACASSIVRSGRRSRDVLIWPSSSASSVIRNARSLVAPPSTTAAATWNASKPTTRSVDSRSPGRSGRARCEEISTPSISAARTASGSAGTGPRSSVPSEFTVTGRFTECRRKSSAATGLRARFPVQMKTTSNSNGPKLAGDPPKRTVADDSVSSRQAACHKRQAARTMRA